MAYRSIFGPVLSGRLGLSLGLDLLCRPVCSMDCVYCEVGATQELTLARAPYVPAEEILAELEDWAASGRHAEIVTLGGSGEPCLNSEMGEVIRGVRRILPGMPVAVLTNSTLMTDPAVRAELALADVVLPSLDSLVEEEFRRINRPVRGVTAAAIAEGLLAFREEFAGALYVEVLLAGGYNDSQENLARLKAYLPRLRPDRVDVTTLSRPGTLVGARAVAPEELARWRAELGASTKQKDTTGSAAQAATPARALPPEAAREMVEASLARRPQTVLQLMRALEADEKSILDAVEALSREGRLTSLAEGSQTFLSLRRK